MTRILLQQASKNGDINTRWRCAVRQIYDLSFFFFLLDVTLCQQVANVRLNNKSINIYIGHLTLVSITCLCLFFHFKLGVLTLLTDIKYEIYGYL